MELKGQVLDPDGHPVAGAELYVVAPSDSPLNNGPPRATSGPDGRFILAAPKSELARHLAAARPVDVMAVAKSFGTAWGSVAKFLPKEERDKVNPFDRLSMMFSESAAVLKLARDEHPLTGRIETPEGKPVRGATVRLESVFANDAHDLGPWVAAIGRNEDFGAAHKYLPRELRGDGLGRFFAVTDWPRAFPPGRDRCQPPGQPAPQRPGAGGGDNPYPYAAGATPGHEDGRLVWPERAWLFRVDFALSVDPGQSIVGVVRDADTGRPVPGAIVQSHRFAGNGLTGLAALRTRADAQGRYRLDGLPAGKGNALLARGPDDQPYLAAVAEVDTSTGDGPVELELKLKRGLWAEGRVTDADTGRPLGADVEYYCFESNRHGAEAPGFTGAILGPSVYHTDAAGRFRVPVLPGPGVVAAKLHGPRSWTLFSKRSSTWQAGKSYIEYRGKFDPPDCARRPGRFIRGGPARVLRGGQLPPDGCHQSSRRRHVRRLRPPGLRRRIASQAGREEGGAPMTTPWKPYVPAPCCPWNVRRVVHLHRRAGFAATWPEIQRDLTDGPAASIERLLTGRARDGSVPADYTGRVGRLEELAVASRLPANLRAAWIYRMLYGPDPLGERLVLLWHNHFATSNEKVADFRAMIRQNALFREYGRAGHSGNCLAGWPTTRPCSFTSTPRPTARSIPTKTWPGSCWSCSPSA